MISQQDKDIKTAMIRYLLICLFSIIVAQTSYATIGTSVRHYEYNAIEPFVINQDNNFNAKNQQNILTYRFTPNGQVETITWLVLVVLLPQRRERKQYSEQCPVANLRQYKIQEC